MPCLVHEGSDVMCPSVVALSLHFMTALAFTLVAMPIHLFCVALNLLVFFVRAVLCLHVHTSV